MAAEESSRFAHWARTTNVDQPTLDSLRDEVAGLARDCRSAPALPLFVALVSVRDALFGVLERGRQRPADTRELYLLAGATCSMLTGASTDLGSPAAAATHARTAWVCAEQTDHPGLRAYVLTVRALGAMWDGRPREAVRLARAGQEHTTAPGTGMAMIRLAGLEARASARLGAAADVHDALHRAEIARDQLPTEGGGDELTELGGSGGVFAFPLAKQHFYAGSAYVQAGEHARAEASSQAAIEAYETGPPAERAHGDEGLARIDVAAARLARGDLDGVRDALDPLLSLPAERRIQPFATALGKLRRTLTGPLHRDSWHSRELQEAIEDFRTVPPVRELGAG